MGISLLTSYHGSQIFEAIGIADDVINKVFKGTPCRVSGLSFDDIALGHFLNVTDSTVINLFYVICSRNY